MDIYVYVDNRNYDEPQPLRELPDRLMEAMDLIRAIRFEALRMEETYRYDPCGDAAKEANRLRDHADHLEDEMERRLGWRV